MLLVTLTAYCICVICTGHTHGITKSGRHAEVGITAACGPDLRGHLIWIEDIGVRWCEDTGSKVGPGRVDVLMSSHAEAKRAGRTVREVVVLR
jgi:3D (Asp-Asp-Asp) domain-containing protein